MIAMGHVPVAASLRGKTNGTYYFEGSVSLCPQIGRHYYHRVYHYGTNWQTVHNE